MQKNDMAEKKRLLWDGIEVPGLVSFQEVSVEKGTIEVPEFKRIRVIQNGILKVPTIQLTYKIARGTNTLKFWRDFFYNDEDKDLTVIRTDAGGNEFARTSLPGCECIKYFEPPFDAANPTYAKIETIIVPWDVIPIG